MKLKNNKKAYSTQLFGFFFVLMIVSGIFLFLSFGMHYLLYDYGMAEVVDISNTILTGAERLTYIEELAQGFLGLTHYFDVLFLVVIIAMFIESTWAALISKEAGVLSFFGFLTIGNLFLIFIMNFAIQIRGWFLNEVVFRILIVEISSPVMTTFFNYSYYIGTFWFIWLVTLNQVDMKPLISLARSSVKSLSTKREGEFEE